MRKVSHLDYGQGDKTISFLMSISVSFVVAARVLG